MFGLFEFPLLELFRRLDARFNIYTMGILDRFILKGRWGGKVVPLNRNIDVDTRFLPTEEIMEILKRSNVVGIGWCYCRTTQRKHGKPNCDHPQYSCLHFGFGKSLYEIPYKSENLKQISKQEVIEFLEECDDRGLVHQLIYFPNPKFYYIVCNCCPCCCLVLNKFIKSGSPRVIKSEFIAITDLSKCKNCGTCEQWCHFGARKIKNGTLKFNYIKCFGCGICISKCPNEAIILKKKEALK